MNCNPERVTGYVDGVLDDPSAAEIKEHLEGCADCREQADFEQGLRKRLKGLSGLEPKGDLEQRVLKASRPKRRRFVKVVLPTAAAFVAIAILGARTSPAFLAWEMEKDHIQCFGLKPLEENVLGGTPEHVASWFQEEGNPIPPPPAAAGSLELLGGRRCMLLDFSIVAHLLYRGPRQASVFILPSTRPIPETYARVVGPHSVRIVRVGSHTVGIVSESPADAEALSRALQETRAWNLPPSRVLTAKALAVNIFVRPVGL